jgi:hypothetical protein
MTRARIDTANAIFFEPSCKCWKCLTPVSARTPGLACSVAWRGYSSFRGSGRPSCACFAIDVREARGRGGDVDGAKHDRQVEAARTDRARVEDSKAAIATDERNVRMAADDERHAFARRHTSDIGAELGAIHRDVDEQDAQLERIALDQVDNQVLGHLARLHVDVAAHRKHRRHLGQAVEHAEISDVARVQDRVGAKLGQPFSGSGVRLGVGVRDAGKPKAAVLANGQCDLAWTGNSGHAGSVAPKPGWLQELRGKLRG